MRGTRFSDKSSGMQHASPHFCSLWAQIVAPASVCVCVLRPVPTILAHAVQEILIATFCAAAAALFFILFL